MSTTSAGPGAAFVTSQAQISNRNLLARMKAWGWDVESVNGDWTSMTAGPMNDRTKYRMEVRSEHTHTKNHAGVFRQVLSIMGLTWEEFMTTDLATQNETIKAQDIEFGLDYLGRLFQSTADQRAMQQEKYRRAEEKKQKRLEAQQKAHEATTAGLNPDQETPMPAPALALAPVRLRKKHERGISNLVFDTLVKIGEPASVARLAQELPQFKYNQVGVSACYLANIGTVIRVKQGVYQVAEKYRHQDVSVSVTARTENGSTTQTLTVVPDSSPDVAPDSAPAEVVTSAQEQPPTVSRPVLTEDIANEVLDLLLPEGFKARHLPLIEAWKRATEALMAGVTG